jgi:hypothetical protein
VVVAVLAVRVVEVAVHEVVDVIAMRDRRVPTAGAVHMVLRVAGAGMARRAVGRVRGVDANGALVDVAFVGVVEVPIVEVIDVVTVADGRVAAARAVDVVVRLVRGMSHRGVPFFRGESSSA